MSKVFILESVTSCNYPSNTKDYITNIICELLNLYKSTKFFKVNRGTQDKPDIIIGLRIVISTLFGNNKFDIAVIVYLPKNFPFSPPDVYIEKPSKDIGINSKNKNIDPISGKIITKTLANWNSYATIPLILNEINISFNENFPLYQMKKENIQNVQHNVQHNVQQNEQQNVQYRPSLDSTKSQSSQDSYSSLNTQNINITTTTPPQQKIDHNEEYSIKSVLINEIKNYLYTQIKIELITINKEKETLQYFKNAFQEEITKYSKYLKDQKDITDFLNQVINDLNEEFAKIQIEVNERKDKVINEENIMSFIKVSDETILKLISIEATYDDMINISKKGFERQCLTFNDTIKFIRFISREIIKLKEYRNKILMNKYKVV